MRSWLCYQGGSENFSRKPVTEGNLETSNQKEKKEVIICYECKKPGYIRSECPLLNKLKKKVMVATWDDSDEDSSDEK